MKEERYLKCKNLLEKELVTVTEKLDVLNTALKDLEDIELELRGIKLFMFRTYPELSPNLPGYCARSCPTGSG